MGFLVIVFLVLYYFYFNTFGHVIHRSVSPAIGINQVVILGIGSFLITRAIWLFCKKVFKIGSPF